MRITRVSASNWRNFKQLDFLLENRLFVVGPNAAGKSNLLDLFRFLGDVAGPGGLATAVENRGGISKIRSLFARSNAGGKVVLQIQLRDGDDEWEYKLALGGEKGGFNRPIVAEEVVRKNGEPLLTRPDSSDRSDPERLTQTHLEQIASNQKFRALAEYFVKVQYFHLVPQIIRNPGRAGAIAGDPYGSDFIASMNSYAEKTKLAWFKRMESALRAAVPEFESLRLELDKAGRPHLVAGYKNWRQMPTKQSEADFSDGTLRLIGLLWTLVSAPKNSGVMLLEEPELSLNAAIVRTLPSVLASAQRDQQLQVVLSTHSPEILDDEGVRPKEILVLRVTGDATEVTLLSDIEEVRGELEADLPKSEIVESLVSPQDLSGLIDVGRTKR